ncbi:MAG TPA: TetR/AcrR family transcriptional regulator [Nitriliruptorales bacterium]
MAMMDTLLAGVTRDDGLPAPDPALAPYLDAAAVVVRRHGWSGASINDIAREAGVDRTTIYRQLGRKDDVFRLVVAREVHHLIERAIDVALSGRPGPELVIELLATSIEYGFDNPVISKLLEDDPEMIARFLARGIDDVIRRFTSTLSPLLGMGMDLGAVARRNPAIVTDWIVRMGLSVLVTRPSGDLREFLSEILLPVLEPEAP